jgi:hypothetical protein
MHDIIRKHQSKGEGGAKDERTGEGVERKGGVREPVRTGWVETREILG